MRSGLKRLSSGYSLAELLVVVAIIGLLSLISVPAFMNFRRSMEFRSTMRNFTTDLRNARAAAIANSYDVRVEVQSGAATTNKNYYFYSSRDNGVTWTELNLPGSIIDPAAPTLAPHMKTLKGSVWTISTANLPDYSMTNTSQTSHTANGMPDIVFHPNGATEIVGGANSTVVLATDWKKIAFDRYTITFSTAGQFRAVGSHT